MRMKIDLAQDDLQYFYFRMMVSRKGLENAKDFICKEWQKDYSGNEEFQLENQFWLMDLYGYERVAKILNDREIEIPDYIISAFKLIG